MAAKRKPKGKRSDGRSQTSWVRPDGHRQWFYGDTLRDAQANKLAYQVDWYEGRISATPPTRETVGQHMTWWLENVAKVRLRPNSYRQYEALSRHHIVPALGTTRLTELTQPQIQEQFVNAMIRGGFKAATVNASHKVLHGALVSVGPRPRGSGQLAWNPSDGIALPKVRKSKGRPLSPEQLAAFLGTCDGHPLGDLFVVQVTLGLRKGEAQALPWVNVDWEAGEVEVTGTLTVGDDGLEASDPKTEASAAWLPMMGLTEMALRRQQDRQAFMRREAGARWQDRGLVFTLTKGQPVHDAALYGAWREITAAAGIRGHTPHDLRYTYSTELARAGVHSRVQMALMRHANVGETMGYTRPDAAMRKAAVQELSERFGRLRTG